MVIRPVNEFRDRCPRQGTIANREVLTRNFYLPVAEADIEHFKKLIDAWALSYAELLSARG